MSEESMEFDIKVISSETIKSSSPIPSDRKTYTLSSLDQDGYPIQSYALLCYTKNKNINLTSTSNVVGPSLHLDTIISSLKICLSQTLSHFYPLAGRYENESIVSCNDQGIIFGVAHVASDISTLLSSPQKHSMLPKLIPSEGNAHFYKGPQPISEVVPLGFQVNVFQCGGIVIGCYYDHKLMDLASWASFLKYWATLVNSASDCNLVEPDFEEAAKAFPPSPKVDHILTVRSPDDMFSSLRSFNAKVVAKSFVVDKNAICELRAKAASERLSHPTRFETVAAFVWEHALAAAYSAGAVEMENDNQAKGTQLLIFADLRARTCPPLSKAAIGNLLTHAAVTVDQSRVTLPGLTAEIHAAVSSLKSLYEGVIGESRTKAITSEPKANSQAMMYKPGSYKLTSWVTCGLSEIDFGFGKPRVIPTDGTTFPLQRNFIYFTEDGHDGFEVWLFLEEKEMHFLESNPQFLAFAVPLYS